MIHIKLTLGHLFPDLLNMYGDRGNVAALLFRLRWRGIDAEVREYRQRDDIDFSLLDIVFLGGGSDHENVLAVERLRNFRDAFAGYVERGGAAIAVCGGYQLLGEYFPAGGEIIEGLHILDIRTKTGPGRLIGNTVVDSHLCDMPVVGFENHGGRTFIGNHKPLGRTASGCGNNGEDGYEGVVYKNLLGTYLHGPLLPKNPQLCDWLLQRAIEQKDFQASLAPLDDTIETEANRYIVKRFLPAHD